MRMTKVLALAAVMTGALACADDPVGAPSVALKIASISPEAVFVEGGELVKVTTENGCAVDQLKVTVRDVEVANVQALDADVYTFAAPPLAVTSLSEETVTFTCAQAPAGTQYAPGKNIASTSLVYDPRLESAPTVASYGPVGDRISVLTKMTVTFSREMNPATITADTVYIDGVDSVVTYDAATNTATVTPKEQLAYGQTFTCVVVGGESGVTTQATGKTLQTTLKPGGGTPDPLMDQWQFTTRREGEGNPWVGDISAAAGLSTGGSYKLFSVTGQPTPVGTAYAGTPENHTYKLQAGFIYATQPPSADQ